MAKTTTATLPTPAPDLVSLSGAEARLVARMNLTLADFPGATGSVVVL